MEAMVSRASFGGTSAAMTASPRTCLHGLQILSAVSTQTKVELVSSNGLLDGVVVAIELIADRGPDEVGAIGIKALMHQEVYVAEIDIAEIDRDLLAIGRFWPQRLDLASHALPSIYHPCGWHMEGVGVHCKGMPPEADMGRESVRWSSCPILLRCSRRPAGAPRIPSLCRARSPR